MCFAKHILERGVIVIDVLVVSVGLITCEKVGVVKRVHTLLGGVHRLATALKVVEEVQEEVQEQRMNGKMRKWKGMEESRSKENRTLHVWMR